MLSRREQRSTTLRIAIALLCAQEGYVCTGACELDEYCQDVLHRHHPGIPVHGNLHTLNLADLAPQGRRLDVVVITTPCVDVSARGQGLAQNGQVRLLLSTLLRVKCRPSHYASFSAGI